MKTVKSTHVGAYGFIIKDDKIALIKKARGGYTGLLDIPGGGIEHNETPVEALKRELMEEAGVTVQNYELLCATSRTFQWQMEPDVIEDLHHIGIIYKVELDNYDILSISELDTDYSKWVDINTITEDMVTPFTWYSLKELKFKK